MSHRSYLNKMRLNIKLAYLKSFSLSLMFFLPVWYAFETQFATPAALGVIYAVTHLVTVGLELPTGALADLLGRKKTIIIGLTLQGLSWILVSQSKDISWLWSGYGLNAIGVALNSGADIALDYDSLKELELEKTFSKFSSKCRIIHRIGMIFSVFMGGYIFNLSKGLPYLLVGLLFLATSMFSFYVTEPKIDSEKFSLQNYLLQTKLGFKEMFKNEYIRDFSIFYIIVSGITWYFLYFLSQAYSTEIGFTAIERSWLYSGLYLIIELLLFILISSNILIRKRVYLLFPAIMIIGFLPGYWLPKTFSIFSLFLIHFISSARFSILDQYTNLEFESKYRATALSSLNMLVSLVFVGITLIAGRFINNFGPGFIMTALGVLTILFVLPISRTLYVNHNHSRV